MRKIHWARNGYFGFEFDTRYWALPFILYFAWPWTVSISFLCFTVHFLNQIEPITEL